MKGGGGGEHVVRGLYNAGEGSASGFVVFKTPAASEGVYALWLSLDDG